MRFQWLQQKIYWSYSFNAIIYLQNLRELRNISDGESNYLGRSCEDNGNENLYDEPTSSCLSPSKELQKKKC